MSSRFSDVTPPVRVGAYIGSFDSVGAPFNTTDWVDVTSATVVDSTTGSACAAGKILTLLHFHNSGSSTMFVKLRGRTLAGDPTTGELAIPAGVPWTMPTAGIAGGAPLTIAIKKAAAGDNIYPEISLEDAP